MILQTRTFLFSLFFVSWLFSQELPPIQNFTPIDYEGENQNWALTQANDGNIFIANNHNLLEFNGVRWYTYDSPNASIFRSVSANDSLVFTGQYMEFGYWKRGAYGDMGYNSISQKLERPMIEDEEFWNIIVLGEWVLFQSLDRIYSYHITSGSFKILDVKTTKAHMFKVAGTVYFQNENQGISKIISGRPAVVAEAKEFKRGNVVGMYSDDDGIIVILDDASFYRLATDGSVDPLPNEIDQLGLNVYSTAQLTDGRLVLGTVSKGLFEVSPQGKLVRIVNQRNGLNNNTVLSLFQDRNANLWLGLDNGISLINLNSPFNEYIDNSGKLGLVYASKLVGERLYLGTNQGLFVKDRNDTGDFKLVAGTQGQVWTLFEYNNTLFCGHNRGTFTIDGDGAELISTFPGTWTIKPMPNQPNLLVQGNYNGLSMLTKVSGKWRFRNQLTGFTISSRFIEFITDSTLLVNHEYKGLFKLKLQPDYASVSVEQTHPMLGYGSSITLFDNKLVYATLEDVYAMDKDTLAFKRDTVLYDLWFDKAKGINGIMLPDRADSSLWAFTKIGLSKLFLDSFNGAMDMRVIPIPDFFKRSLGVTGFENMEPIGKQQYLIGISNGYVTLDAGNNDSKTFKVVIDRVSVQEGFKQPKALALSGDGQLEPEQNTVRILYGVSQYTKYDQVRYQYRLKGLFNEWSDFTEKTEVTFSSLPYGDYEFMVRGKVGNTMVKDTATYRFSISRPWYWSTMAMVAYGLLLLGIFFLVHKLYKGYYTKKQQALLDLEKKKQKRKKLKTEKELVQLKNDKLKSEIESKNRELAVATMSLIKKNEFLATIKNQLAKASNGHEIQKVVATIDTNINSKDDWQFFEKAFNNADKDFLKKVKIQHPELTPNDLKLCAYLRLNLSSKDIAPLLNISNKSVEVKRYRLRKKMNLPHEKSLVEYILSL
ncbi:Two component regulator three Y domain-containing protein [Croceitalea dokdonensis DOKDO 023]|uniref:Two component regulator three Y domain-containing protein n=1 Tax=Croceitalea dokdonensis DOKDO 023 TaxID=1300341 RepID=A0A0P7ARX4_9FLAO|nr:triple tyrosine motif-containing protein [Croceitalea dokdonensis]KPM30663.1 Two component regulator three Y domain-containing protein [Croceitalea dokdonensis DOKDO 023]